MPDRNDSLCWMGHEDCYDTHEQERLADEADYLQSLEDEPWLPFTPTPTGGDQRG